MIVSTNPCTCFAARKINNNIVVCLYFSLCVFWPTAYFWGMVEPGLRKLQFERCSGKNLIECVQLLHSFGLQRISHQNELLAFMIIARSSWASRKGCPLASEWTQISIRYVKLHLYICSKHIMLAIDYLARELELYTNSSPLWMMGSFSFWSFTIIWSYTIKKCYLTCCWVKIWIHPHCGVHLVEFIDSIVSWWLITSQAGFSCCKLALINIFPHNSHPPQRVVVWFPK